MNKKSPKLRVYTRKFKTKAVALAKKQEKPVSQVAKDLGISEKNLYRWIQTSRETEENCIKTSLGHGHPRYEELILLRKEVKLLRQVNEILKKINRIAESTPEMAYQFIYANRNRYTVKEMTRLLGVSSAAYYQWVRKNLQYR